jgi:hypothetical protein
LPEVAPLDWGAAPSTDELVEAGVSAKNLLEAGVPVETLLQAGASVLALQQAGVESTTLAEAGVAAETLAANQQALTVLSTLETLPQMTVQVVDETGIPLALEDYRLTLPNSTPRVGQLDNQGQLQFEIAAGATFTLELPNLDGNDWDVVQNLVEPSDYIDLVLVDETGTPLANQDYLITLPDGSIRHGSVDSEGQAKVTGITAGLCEISFPNLDAQDWELSLPPEAPTDLEWLNFTLTQTDDTPMPNTRYALYQGETLIHEGWVASGEAVRIPGLAAGAYELSFLDLDADDWELT